MSGAWRAPGLRPAVSGMNATPAACSAASRSACAAATSTITRPPAVATALSLGAATLFAGGNTPLAVVLALIAALIAGHRGSSPVVFVSHRPNIDLLTLELIGEGELIVARANVKGELDVLGKIYVRP